MLFTEFTGASRASAMRDSDSNRLTFLWKASRPANCHWIKSNEPDTWITESQGKTWTFLNTRLKFVINLGVYIQTASWNEQIFCILKSIATMSYTVTYKCLIINQPLVSVCLNTFKHKSTFNAFVCALEWKVHCTVVYRYVIRIYLFYVPIMRLIIVIETSLKWQLFYTCYLMYSV